MTTTIEQKKLSWRSGAVQPDQERRAAWQDPC